MSVVSPESWYRIYWTAMGLGSIALITLVLYFAVTRPVTQAIRE